MKKIILVVVIVCFVFELQAQLLLDSTSSHRVEGYAGFLTGPVVSIDSGKVNSFETTRIGSNLYWTPSTTFTLYGIASMEWDQKGKGTNFYHLGIKVKPVTWLTATIGKIGTPMTELRPLPNTEGGQFEPWTKAQILGSALGIKTSFKVSPATSIVVGSFWRDVEASYEAGIQVPHFQVALYYKTKSHSFGGACSVTFPNLSETIVYNHGICIGSVTNISISKTKGLSFYSDMGFEEYSYKMVHGEWGLLKSFNLKTTRGLFGFGYSYEARTIKGYLTITL